MTECVEKLSDQTQGTHTHLHIIENHTNIVQEDI